MKKYAIVAIAAVALAWNQHSAKAQTNVYSSSDAGPGIKSIDIIPVDNSGVPALADYTTQDIVITFEGNLLSNQFYLELDAGSVYIDYDFGGGPGAPNGNFFGAFPNIEFNTFYGLGGRTTQQQIAIGEVLIAGGAVDLGGPLSASYTPQLLNQNWAPNPGVTISDRTDFFMARITLSNDADGIWRFTTRSAVGGVGERVFLNDDSKFIVDNGQLLMVPEPSAILLGCCGVAGVIGVAVRRRRKVLAD